MWNWIVSLIFKIVEPLLSLLEHLGLKEPLKKRLSEAWIWAVAAMTMLVASVWATLQWLWGITPLWAVPFLLIGVVTAFATTILWIIWLTLRLIEQ
jgi:hypothetical protein